jgi:hypothetical protein
MYIETELSAFNFAHALRGQIAAIVIHDAARLESGTNIIEPCAVIIPVKGFGVLKDHT